jgi:acetoin utilization deacetylase AcuC-like enzyme
MSSTAIVYSNEYLLHKTGHKHPESPARLRVINRELQKSGILKHENVSVVEPQPIKLNQLTRVHTPNYVRFIKNFCNQGGGSLDEDTEASPQSYDVALLAASGAVNAVDLVMAGKHRNAFAFVRPPGHHAGPNYAMGFCLFNNVAVATSELIHKYNLKRVLILDIDAHHGNGTQDIFYETNKVLYISLHEDPTAFPLTGFTSEVGKKAGTGFTVNIPFPNGTDDLTYLKAFNQIAVPIMHQYKPQFILLSTGFDNHYTDPVGKLILSAQSYIKIFDTTLELASQYCQDKLVSVLEGGYNLQNLGKLACATTARMAEIPYTFKDKHPGATLKTRRVAEKVIEKARRVQSNFWNMP